MDLSYSSEQNMLRDSAARYLENKCGFDHFRKMMADGAAHDTKIWSGFAELGWLAMPISEAGGGLGGGGVEVGIIAEQMGRWLALAPFIPAVVLAGGLVDELGTEAQHRRLLAPLIDGSQRLALAHNERDLAFGAASLTATAMRSEGGYRLNASKTLVMGGAGAATLLVSAMLGEATPGRGRIGVFVVPADAPGVSVSRFKTPDGSSGADIACRDVALGADALLGDGADAGEAIERAFDRAAAASCWDAVGAMDALLAATITFTKQRVQFGKPLASFQTIAHRIAEMGVKCTEARAIALLASLSLDASRDLRIRGVSGAKAKIGRISRSVAQEAVQLHGAMGFTDELPVGWWFKRLFVFENLYGATRQHLARYGAVATQTSIQAESLLRASRGN